MFTGIIQTIGSLKAVDAMGGDVRFTVASGSLDMGNVALGDSIANNGVCLTVIEKGRDSFSADVSRETLSCTSLGELVVGDKINLEKAMTPENHFGGHMVSGHVDAVGEVVKRWSEGRSVRFQFKAPGDLGKYIAAKGSICIDGISLTVNTVSGGLFDVNIVPHTLVETNLGDKHAGSRVNLEVDLVARYVERLLSFQRDEVSDKPTLTREFLSKNGFDS